MRIGILGPISTASVAHLLPGLRADAPRGATSAPMLGTLIDALVADGHEVVGFTLVPARELAGQHTRLTGPALTLHYCPSREHSIRFRAGTPGRALDGFRLERRQLVQAMGLHDLDVVHAHWFYEYAAAALDQSRAPAVVTGHDDPWRVLHHMPSLYRASRFALARGAMRRAGLLTAVSPTLAWRITRFTGAPVHVVPNPLPASLLQRPIGDGNNLPPRLGMALNGWSRLKNGAAALRAFALLRRERPDATLELFGADLEPGGPAQRWARQHGLAEGVVFVGGLDRDALLARIAGLAGLVHPSREESFGLVLAEAMALGVPVLAGRRSGAVPWLLEHGRCGELVEVNDDAALARAMARLLLPDPTRAQRLHDAADRVRALCDPAAVARAYLAAYRQATGTAERPTRRVLHVLNELMPSGAEVMLRAAADHWRAHGVQASVLGLGERPGPFAPVLRQAGYAVHHRPLVPDLRFLLAFARLLRTEGVDVLHLHAERASFWLALAARLAGVRRIVRTVHGNFLFEGWLRHRRGLSRALTRWLGTHQVTISDAVCATERQRFGNPSEVIPNWFDSTRLRVADGATRQAARTRLGLAPEDFVIVTVGNCAPVKNHDSLFEALAGLRGDTRWIYLHVGCEQPGEPERALAAHLGIASRVRFLGLLPDVSDVLAAADLYVMPSRREGLGVAALEAIGCGVPTLLGDVPGLRELAAQFPSVLRCGVDAASLAAAIGAVLAGDLDLARQRAARDAERAHERFGVERGVAAYARAYAGLPPPPAEAGGSGRMAQFTG